MSDLLLIASFFALIYAIILSEIEEADRERFERTRRDYGRN